MEIPVSAGQFQEAAPLIGNLNSISVKGEWISTEYYQSIYYWGFSQKAPPQKFGESSPLMRAVPVYLANFNQNIAKVRPIPEKAPKLDAVSDFENRKLFIDLSSSTEDTCRLVWDLGNIPDRFSLQVIGCGDWDAVYSGDVEDRPPEVVQNDSWSLNQYMNWWWQPVLKQVVNRHFGVNIIQQGKSSYKIDVYRRDQVGTKSAISGKYSFKGNPIETFVVSDQKNNSAVIAGSEKKYKIGEYSFIIENSSGEVLEKIIATSASGTMQIQTTLDGVNLPKLKKSFAGNGDPNVLEEIGFDGTRKTNFTYSGTGIDKHISGIVQNGGLNPYSATYNEREMLTHFESGPNTVDISYSGTTVTRVEKVNGNVTGTRVSQYSGDMTRITTTMSGVSGAVPAIVEYYPGNDSINPWALRKVRDFDGTLVNYSYGWKGNNFVTTVLVGGGASATDEAVTAGTQTVTEVNSAGQVVWQETKDIASGVVLDFARATQFQHGVFPARYDRPLGTSESYTYDAQGRVLSHTDRLGKTETYERDALDRITKITRAGIDWNIAYNPFGQLGCAITSGTRAWTETVSPFGKTSTLAITGPENITVNRTENVNSITTQVTNATLGQSRKETLSKTTLAMSGSGSNTEPWTLNRTFGNGGSATLAQTGAAGLSSIVSYDALGRLTSVQSPSPTGTGTVTTNFSHTASARKVVASDPSGSTTYEYAADGSLKKIGRGGRHLEITRQDTGNTLGWKFTDAANRTLWSTVYTPKTGTVEDLPWGSKKRAVSVTPSIAGDVVTLTGNSAVGSILSKWKDGAPYQGSASIAGATSSWTATADAYGVVSSVAATLGGGGTTTTNFSPLGLPTSTTGLAGLDTTNFSYHFSGTGIVATATRSDKNVTQRFSPKGYLTGSEGYGRVDETWSAPSYGGSTVTRTLTTGAGNTQFTWNYAGELIKRKFPDNSEESFTYDARGGLASWTTPRGTFTCTNNAFGEPTEIKLSGTTIASMSYDTAGQLSALSDTAGQRLFSYVEGQLLAETHQTGPLATQYVGYGYDDQGRRNTVYLPGGAQIRYTYDSNGKLVKVTTAGGTEGTWSNFNAVNGKAGQFTMGGYSVENTFDALGRQTGQSGSSLSFDSYGRCTTHVTPTGTWTLFYDSYGYLSAASRSGGGPSLTYTWDEVGRHPEATDYRPTLRINSSTVAVFGSVHPSAILTINGSTIAVSATTGKFSQNYTPTASTWQTYTIRGVLSGSGVGGSDAIAEEVRKIFVPPVEEDLDYDASGNRSGDAQWTYAWNKLDQLVEAEEHNPESGAVARKLEFTHDLEGRRVEKRVKVNGALTKRITTLYDGWRPILDIEYSGTGLEIARRIYTWGPDVSGSLDGAAGIGGLIEIFEIKNGISQKFLPVYDSAGNIVQLLDNLGAPIAAYEYGPFGEKLDVDGSAAESCPLRFQTKRYDSETGLYYFGKRYYDPKTQTWLSHDPIRESGGANLYAYCGNNPVGNCDPIGLMTDNERVELESMSYGLIRMIGLLGGDPRTPGEVFNERLKTTGLSNPGLGFYFWLPIIGTQYIALDNKAELRSQYPSWESDQDVALRESVRSNTVQLNVLLARQGILPRNQRIALQLRGLGLMAETSLDLGLMLAPYGRIAELARPTVLLASLRQASVLPTVIRPELPDSGIRKRVLANISESARARASSGFRQWSQTTELRALTSEAAAEVDSLGMATFTARQQRAIISHPNLQAAFRGSAIDRRVRAAVQNDPFLRQLQGSPNRGADFIDPYSESWWDMTTPAQWPKHIQQYGPGGTLLPTK